ncbi:MAG: transposase family protein [Verrucomicrobia bacterium]|nr:MAG: transposase family protein [Verrucomicrobiota bacterium]
MRRWQCSKIGALWQLDATPHRWWPDGPMLPLLNMLDDCSRRRVGAQIYPSESLLAYLDFLPRAFLLHGLPLRLYVDCHSFFLEMQRISGPAFVYLVELKWASKEAGVLYPREECLRWVL